MKIGLYIQAKQFQSVDAFNDLVKSVKLSDIDLLVFPELSWFPQIGEYKKLNFFDEADRSKAFKFINDLSVKTGKAIVFCCESNQNVIMSVYANAFANVGETRNKYYIKHTMVEHSAFEMNDYENRIDELFAPAILKGQRIGLTICYDCNHAFFSRKYGLNGVDILINSTGGDVVFDKWLKYNKARSIENKCFSFVTMGLQSKKKNQHNYVYGINSAGDLLVPRSLTAQDEGCILKNGKNNCEGKVYVYDTEEYSTYGISGQPEKESINKKVGYYFNIHEFERDFNNRHIINDWLTTMHYNGDNIIFIHIKGEEILRPDIVAKALYDNAIDKIKNKRYVIVNRWNSDIDKDYYTSILDPVLRVRAMENYCAVVLIADNIQKCYQTGKNRTSQIVGCEENGFGIDLTRVGGPDVIWRNKKGMRKNWRNGLQKLITTF